MDVPTGVPMAVIDSQGMFDAAASLPDQVREAAFRSKGLDRLPNPSLIEQVVVLGIVRELTAAGR